MSPLDRLIAERACERLIHLYALHADHHQHDEMANLFADDGSLDRGDGPVVGREAIRCALNRRRPDSIVRHVCSNVIIEVRGERTASATSVMTLYRTFGSAVPPQKLAPAEMIVDYRDRFVLAANGWRIQERLSEIILMQDE